MKALIYDYSKSNYTLIDMLLAKWSFVYTLLMSLLFLCFMVEFLFKFIRDGIWLLLSYSGKLSI